MTLHEQLAEKMRELIRSGVWAENYRLKAEPELAKDFGVSRGTLRRASKSLVSEGALVHVHGRGTFVSSSRIKPALTNTLNTLSEEFLDQGYEWKTTVIDSSLCVVPEKLCQLFALEQTQKVFRLTRTGWSATIPVAYLINYVLLDVAKGIEEIDFSQSSLFAVLEKRFGLDIDGGRRTFSAVSAPRHVSETLGIAADSPVQLLEQITTLVDGRVVEYSDVWINSREIRVTSQLARRRSHEPA